MAPGATFVLVHGVVKEMSAGRPVGSVEDPTSLSRRQLISDYKFYRTIVERLKERYEEGKSSMNPKDLIEIAQFLQGSIERQMKFHLAPAKAAPPAPDEAAFDPEKLLEEIIKGD